ncbi:hypothetical protein SBA6_490019 [Candidatus Sulfopaludibacter sp. SbA6]|nr:hypothetical protein SBA6_490019 [Candidatus Sulfopaludibacter sp. SbA6]
MRSAADILGQGKSSLEEIEREKYKGREVWAITLGVPRNLDVLSPMAQIGADPIQYKRFLIDVETGEMLGMIIREPASR